MNIGKLRVEFVAGGGVYLSTRTQVIRLSREQALSLAKVITVKYK